MRRLGALRPFGLFLPAIKYAIGPIASACGTRIIIKSNQPQFGRVLIWDSSVRAQSIKA
jgi:hypothetical protein